MFACLYSPSSGLPREVLERVARDFSPRIETWPAEPGQGSSESLVLVDISGLDRLIGGPQAIGEELQAGLRARTTTPHTSHVALAGTRVVAQLIARHFPGLMVIARGSEPAAIATLPICSLTALGAPPDLLTTLERWGLPTLGAFAALPAKQLAGRLGSDGLVWQRIARGEDLRPLVPALLEERFEDILDLEWPLEGIEPLAFVLGRVLDPLCARLSRRDRAVAAITLRLRFAVSRTWQTRRLELPSPMREPRMLRTLLCLDLEGHPEALLGPDGNPGGIDRIGVFIDPTTGPVAQFSLLARPAVAPEAVATLMARLRALMGQDRCGIARLVDTYRPGAFVMADFSPSNPVNLVNLVNPISRSLRRLRHPIPARVVVEQGRPVRVTTDRRGWNGGRVIWCAGPWRTSGDWWKSDHVRSDGLPHVSGIPSPKRSETTECRAGAPYSWQEWDVALSDGGHYRIHEDRPVSHWFINAILD